MNFFTVMMIMVAVIFIAPLSTVLYYSDVEYNENIELIKNGSCDYIRDRLLLGEHDHMFRKTGDALSNEFKDRCIKEPNQPVSQEFLT